MSHRRVNRSKKIPGVKLRPAPATYCQDIDVLTPDSTWNHSSGLDSDEETSRADLCPRPFKGFVLCATGINDKTSLFKLALELGAQSVSDLTDRVTHLIAEEHGSPKYRCALENRILIMHPSWIIESHKVWLRGDDVDVAESVQEHRLPVFSDVILCVSGIEDVNRRMEINREVTKAGGTYVKQLERPVKVTHLLCANTSEGESEKVRYAQKFNSMGEARIHIVWEDWFWDSLRFGGRFDEEAYTVSNPRPPPRALPEEHKLPSALDESGLSSEIQNAQTSAAPADALATLNEDEDEIASVKRVPAVTLHLWQSILKPRGFEVQDGRLIRSPSKSQAPPQARTREVSPSRAAAKRLARRGTLKVGGDADGPISVLSAFRRSRSFMPAPNDMSTPVGPGGMRQPFQRTSNTSRASSFLLRPVGSIKAAGGVSAEIPIASTSAVAGPSCDASIAAEGEDGLANATAGSEAAKIVFKDMRFRALGEAKCAGVRSAIEEYGGTWALMDDDADIIIVRLVSGSTIFRQEADHTERAKYRTECWLERCMHEERVCSPDDHITFTPLKAEVPIPGSEEMHMSFSGLDSAETFWIRRLLRAMGIASAANFSRRVTHLLCPCGVGAKADKAREWGTPIVDMVWLAIIANTGQIPSISTSPAEEDEVLDLKAVNGPRDPEEWMASQLPASPPSVKGKGKGKEKATEVTMVDITNAESVAPRAQSLSYYDPPPDELRPGQADQMLVEAEAFGMPGMLLAEETPQIYELNPENVSVPTQSTAERLEDDQVSIPDRVYEDRVPSSESPSPMRMPGARTPRTPAKVTKQVTIDFQARINTLLGKRPSDEAAERAHPAKLQARESRMGKRSKPQRTRSSMSHAELQTPDKDGSPALQLASPALLPPEPDLLPQLAKTEPDQKALHSPETQSASGVGENSFTEESLRVEYADPQQDGELDRLKYLFRPEQEGQREPWEIALDAEMTLPQLPRAGLGKRAGGSRGGRGRRTRARKSVKA